MLEGNQASKSKISIYRINITNKEAIDQIHTSLMQNMKGGPAKNAIKSLQSIDHITLDKCINQQSKRKPHNTLLIQAVSRSSLNISLVSTLLSKGANPLLPDFYGETPSKIIQSKIDSPFSKHPKYLLSEIQQLLTKAEALWINNNGTKPYNLSSEFPIDYQNLEEQIQPPQNTTLANPQTSASGANNEFWRAYLNEYKSSFMDNSKGTQQKESKIQKFYCYTNTSQILDNPTPLTEDITNLYHSFDYQAGKSIYQHDQEEQHHPGIEVQFSHLDQRLHTPKFNNSSTNPYPLFSYSAATSLVTHHNQEQDGIQVIPINPAHLDWLNQHAQEQEMKNHFCPEF